MTKTEHAPNQKPRILFEYEYKTVSVTITWMVPHRLYSSVFLSKQRNIRHKQKQPFDQPRLHELNILVSGACHKHVLGEGGARLKQIMTDMLVRFEKRTIEFMTILWVQTHTLIMHNQAQKHGICLHHCQSQGSLFHLRRIQE